MLNTCRDWSLGNQQPEASEALCWQWARLSSLNSAGRDYIETDTLASLSKTLRAMGNGWGQCCSSIVSEENVPFLLPCVLCISECMGTHKWCWIIVVVLMVWVSTWPVLNKEQLCLKVFADYIHYPTACVTPYSGYYVELSIFKQCSSIFRNVFRFSAFSSVKRVSVLDMLTCQLHRETSIHSGLPDAHQSLSSR